MLIAGLVVLVVVLIVVAGAVLLRGENRSSPLGFYTKARDAGFSFAETRSIAETAKSVGLKDTSTALWSARDLDTCIRAFARRFKTEGRERDREVVRFMEKLYDLRKKLEFDQPKYKMGIGSSRSIRVNQRVRILVGGMGVFQATVIDNDERYLVVSYPVGARVPAGFQWKGQRVSVYFWRQDDAGYVFDTYVLEDLRIRNIPVIQIGHSESLLRTQKRKSLRLRSRVPAYLYLLKRLEGAYEKPERVPGMKCVLQDLSEDGVAVLIGGKAKVGLLVKVQFYLGEDQVVISGTVRGAEFDSATNRSTLHVECVLPSARTRNIISGTVYGAAAGIPPGGVPPSEPRKSVELDGKAFSG